MFKKSDKYWFWARSIFNIVALIGGVCSLVLPIVYASLLDNWWFILYIPAGFLVTFVAWIFEMLLLSFFFDVKAICNKLYEESNEKFEDFYNENKQYAFRKWI